MTERVRDAELEAVLAPLRLDLTRYRTLLAIARAGRCAMSNLIAGSSNGSPRRPAKRSVPGRTPKGRYAPSSLAARGAK